MDEGKLLKNIAKYLKEIRLQSEEYHIHAKQFNPEAEVYFKQNKSEEHMPIKDREIAENLVQAADSMILMALWRDENYTPNRSDDGAQSNWEISCYYSTEEDKKEYVVEEIIDEINFKYTVKLKKRNGRVFKILV